MDRRKGLLLFNSNKSVNKNFLAYVKKQEELGNTLPSSNTLSQIEILYDDLDSLGVFEKADRIPLFGVDGGISTSLVDLKEFDRPAIASAGVVYTSKVGLNLPNNTELLRSDYIADTDNVNFQLNDMTVLIYNPLGVTNAAYLGGWLGAVTFEGLHWGKSASARVNSNDQTSPLINDNFSGLRRTSSSDISSINGNSITDHSSTSAKISNRYMAWGIRNGSTSAPNLTPTGFGYIGGALTNEQITGLNSAIVKYFSNI